MQLTNEIKSKIFHLYCPCEVCIQIDNYGIRKMTGVKQSSPHLLVGVETLDIESCKLILTPISEITDEDAISAYDIEHPKNEASDLDKVESLKMWIETDAIGRDVADFLRSRGYALPYMGIDLFETGIAIPKTKKL